MTTTDENLDARNLAGWPVKREGESFQEWTARCDEYIGQAVDEDKRRVELSGGKLFPLPQFYKYKPESDEEAPYDEWWLQDESDDGTLKWAVRGTRNGSYDCLNELDYAVQRVADRADRKIHELHLRLQSVEGLVRGYEVSARVHEQRLRIERLEEKLAEFDAVESEGGQARPLDQSFLYQRQSMRNPPDKNGWYAALFEDVWWETWFDGERFTHVGLQPTYWAELKESHRPG